MSIAFAFPLDSVSYHSDDDPENQASYELRKPKQSRFVQGNAFYRGLRYSYRHKIGLGDRQTFTDAGEIFRRVQFVMNLQFSMG